VSEKEQSHGEPATINPRNPVRQRSETVDEFLQRLPPKDSPNVGPWIWIRNPHNEGRVAGRQDEDQGDSEQLNDRGHALLEKYEGQAAKVEKEMEGKAQSAITRKLNLLRNRLKEDLAKVAVEERCLSGKVCAYALYLRSCLMCQ